MVFGVVLVAGLLGVLGLLARRPVPTLDVVFEGVGIQARLIRGPQGEAWIDLPARADLESQRLALFWTPLAVSDTRGLPEDAYWLGAWPVSAARSFRLPSAEEGTLLLYSLALQRTVETARVDPARIRVGGR